MKSKLGFAISTAIKPDILILDEVLSVGDALFRRKAFVRMENLIKDENTTVLFVSHSEQSVVQICSRAIWLEKGEQVFSNNAKEVIEEYQRFIYSQEESQKQILGQIRLKNDIGKQPEILTPGDNHIKRPLIKNYNDHFLPELVSKSIRIYGDYNVHISDIMIINKKKQKVNLLKSGESYQLVYRVESRENAGNVKLGMRIKTISSVDISIASYTLGTMNIGDTYDIQWSFKCILLPGDYYLNIGINGDINGKAVVLKRITDVLLIRVVKTAEKDELISYWGLVSMKQEIEIQKPVTIKD
jgi:lipopolysaccharide transport system ATP-binding protein